MEKLNKLGPDELFRLAEKLSRITVFGPWTKDREDGFYRREPAREPHRSRVLIWYCYGNAGQGRHSEAGWYWRVGPGVVGIAGCDGQTAHERAEDCMEDVDLYVASDPLNLLVGHIPAPIAGEEEQRVLQWRLDDGELLAESVHSPVESPQVGMRYSIAYESPEWVLGIEERCQDRDDTFVGRELCRGGLRECLIAAGDHNYTPSNDCVDVPF